MLSILRCYADVMTEWTPFFAQTGLIIGLFAWLRNDINLLRQEMNARLEETNARIDVLREEMNSRFDTARKETNAQFETARKETNAQFETARKETNTQFGTARKETNAQFGTARKETGEQFTGLHNDFQAIDVRLARVEATLETTFRLQGILPADRKEQVA